MSDANTILAIRKVKNRTANIRSRGFATVRSGSPPFAFYKKIKKTAYFWANKDLLPKAANTDFLGKFFFSNKIEFKILVKD